MSWFWMLVLNAVMVVGVVALCLLRATSTDDTWRRRWTTVILAVVLLAAGVQLLDVAGVLG